MSAKKMSTAAGIAATILVTVAAMGFYFGQKDIEAKTIDRISTRVDKLDLRMTELVSMIHKQGSLIGTLNETTKRHLMFTQKVIEDDRDRDRMLSELHTITKILLEERKNRRIIE